MKSTIHEYAVSSMRCTRCKEGLLAFTQPGTDSSFLLCRKCKSATLTPSTVFSNERAVMVFYRLDGTVGRVRAL